MNEIIGYGGKDGGAGHTATEAANSLRSKAYASIVDLISEGEIGGLVDGYRSIYLNNVPLQTVSQGEQGLYNFQGVHVDTRNGTQSQGFMVDWPDVENEININVQVKKDTPYRDTVTTDAGIDALRIKVMIPQLSSLDTSNGDLNGTEVEIAIELQSNSGGYVKVVSDKISGKTMAKYERAYRVNMTGTGPWHVRVSRVTADSTLSTLNNETWVSSITEITDAKLSYPNSAIVGIKVDASQFSGVPTRAYDVKLLKIRIPNNYNPTTRAYTGIWDGTFKTAWSDNPAWCFYDLVTNARYGLGDFISEAAIDKWSLYKIAKYCDVLVDDGFGAKEPRFAMNCYLQTRAEAYKVVTDLASAFRGITFWSSGSIMMAQDSSSDPVNLFTNANVIGGEFQYTGSSVKTRHTVAIVTWNDMQDMCRQKVEYVEDIEGISRYGIVQTDIVGFGCTSRAQAHRLGQWILLSERTETETATFKTALEGALVYPGSVIKVRDNNRYGDRFGGRVVASTNTSVTIDSTITIKAATEYTLYVTLSDWAKSTTGNITHDGDTNKNIITPFVISNQFGDTNVLNVSSFGGKTINVNSPWILSETGAAKDKLYRVISVAESTDGLVEVAALEHNAAKFNLVDSSIGPGSFIGSGGGGTTTPITLGTTVALPTGLKVTPRVVMIGTTAVIKIDVSWNSQSDAKYFNLDWKWNKDEYTSVSKIVSGNYTIDNGKEGYYYVRIQAVGSVDTATSGWVYAAAPFATGAIPSDPLLLSASPGFLQVRLDWEYPIVTTGIASVDIYASTTRFLDDDIKIGTVNFPGTSFVHSSDSRHHTLPPGMEHWYRIVLRSQYDQCSTKFPTAGVMAACNVDVTDIINGLGDSFIASNFYKDLTGQIKDIPLPKVPTMPDITGLVDALTGLGNDITGLQTEVTNSVKSLEGSLIGVELEADRILKNLNGAGEVVLHDVVESQTIKYKVNDGLANIQESFNVVQDGAALEANNRMVLAVSVGNAQAAIAQEQLARSDGENAFAQSMSVLAANVENGDASSKALIIEQANVTSSLTSAQATKFTELSAVVAQNKLTSDAQILEVSNVSANLNSATASQISLLAATISNSDTSSKALILNESIATANLNSAQASKTTALEASFTSNLNNVASAANAAVLQNSKALASDALAQATQLSALVAQVNTNNTNAMSMIAEESKARASQVSAEASRVSTIAAGIANQGNSSNASISNLSVVQSNLADSQAASTTALMAGIKQGKDSSNALIVEQSRVMADLSKAVASSTTALQAVYNVGTANNNSTVINQAIAFANANETVVQSINSLQATFDNSIAATNALIISESAARATATNALAQSISGLSTTFGTGLSAITSKVVTENLAFADINGSMASQITQVSSGIGNTVQQKITSEMTDVNGGLYNVVNNYTIKMSADNKTVAGFGLSSETTGIGSGAGAHTKSVFAVCADKFVIAPATGYDSASTNAGTKGSVPFEVLTVAESRTVGNQTISVPPGVYMTRAMMYDGFITNAYIGNAQVETLKIAGNAVTIPVSTSTCHRTTNDTNDGGGWTILANLYLPHTNVASVVFIVTVTFHQRSSEFLGNFKFGIGYGDAAYSITSTLYDGASSYIDLSCITPDIDNARRVSHTFHAKSDSPSADYYQLLVYDIRNANLSYPINTITVDSLTFTAIGAKR